MSPGEIDPAILAERRAKRAEIAEEQLQERLTQAQREIDRLQGRADALSGELELARERRDEMAGQIDGLQRELRHAHQREHAERQLRIETHDELDQARRDGIGAHDELRAQLREVHQRAEELERELYHRRRDVDHAQGLIERHAAARARAEATADEHQARMIDAQDELEALREVSAEDVEGYEAELARRDELQAQFAQRMEQLRGDVEALRERHETNTARQALARTALHDVIDAAARMRARLDQAQLLRAEAQERLALTRGQLDERDEQLAHAMGELERATIAVASLEAQLHSERERTAAALDAADEGLRAQIQEQAAAYEAMLASMRHQLQTAFEAQTGAPTGPSPRETELTATVAGLHHELERLRAQATAEAARDRERAALVAELMAMAGDLRARYAREADRVQARIDTERDRHEVDRARLQAQLAPAAPPPPEEVIAELSRAAQRLRAATPPPAEHEPEPEPESPAEPPPEPSETMQWQSFHSPAPQEPISAWLTPALAALGQTDVPAATEILVALLALQGRTGRSLLYELSIPGSGMWRVSIHHGVADIVRDARRAYDGSAAFHIAGGPQDVAVLAGGGRTGLGAGARVSGKRRQARKLLRAGRDPVGLADAALLLDPGQALALLTAAPAAAGVRDAQLAIELCAAGGADERRWHVIADAGGMRAAPGPCPPGGPAAEAVLRGSPADIVALLGGTPPHGISVAGDAGAAQAMMHLIAAIQRV